MKIVEQGNVRFIVGEMSRGQLLRFWQEAEATRQATIETDDETIQHRQTVEQFAADTDWLAFYAIKRIEVCKDGEWRPVTKAVELDNGATLTAPLTIDQVRDLPVSLFNKVAQAAQDENGGVNQIMLFLAVQTASSGTTSNDS